MTQHYCLSDDYPGGRIVCLCVRGEDHPEALFDAPLGSVVADVSYLRDAAPWPGDDGDETAVTVADLTRYHAAAGCARAAVSIDMCADDSDFGRQKMYLNSVAMIMHHDMYLALDALNDVDPARAKEVAQRMVGAALDGSSYGEWLWQWTRKAGVDADRVCDEARATLKAQRLTEGDQ